MYYRNNLSLFSKEIKVISELFNEITLRESCSNNDEQTLILILKQALIILKIAYNIHINILYKESYSKLKNEINDFFYI